MLPIGPARLIATDLVPTAVEEVIELEPGPNHYDPREGYRDVGVSRLPPVVTRSSDLPEYPPLHYVELYVTTGGSGVLLQALLQVVNLVLLWKRGEKIVGVIFVGAVASSDPVEYGVTSTRVRWRYERAEEIR